MRKIFTFTACLVLTAVCAFSFGFPSAQNELKRPFDRESMKQIGVPVFEHPHEHTRASLRQGNPANFNSQLRSETAKQQLDSMVAVGVQKLAFKYDNNGNLIMQTNYFWDNIAWVEVSRFEFEYDDNGNVITEAFYNTREAERKTRFEYDNYGNRVVIIRYNWTGSRWVEYQKTEQEFDSNGNMTMWSIYFWNVNRWIVDFRTEWIFDSNGDMTMSIIRVLSGSNILWKWEFRTERTYDNGNLIMRVQYVRDYGTSAWFEERKDKFEYDNNGNMILATLYRWINNMWEAIAKNEFAYDNNGNRVMLAVYSWNNEIEAFIGIFKDEFAYDNDGNQLMRARYLWNIANNDWAGNFREKFEVDSSVSINEVFIPTMLEGRFSNKPTARRTYAWVENAWSTTATAWSLHYSAVSPVNIPSVSANDISIFPNPAVDSFTISGITETTLVTLTDVNGRILLQQMVSPNENISVSHLSAGIYIVNVNGKSQKLIVR